MSVTLVSSDDKSFEVPIEVARRSRLISKMVDECGDNDCIPLPLVTSRTLETILKFCSFEFPKEKETLYELLNAAHYLDIPDLVDQGCKVAAEIS